MQMTQKERAIIKALAKFQEKGFTEISLDDVCAAVYTRHNVLVKKPRSWRNAMAATIRNLSAKVEREGCRLRRVSRLGTKAKAVYEFRGGFAKFLQSR